VRILKVKGLIDRMVHEEYEGDKVVVSIALRMAHACIFVPCLHRCPIELTSHAVLDDQPITRKDFYSILGFRLDVPAVAERLSKWELRIICHNGIPLLFQDSELEHLQIDIRNAIELLENAFLDGALLL